MELLPAVSFLPALEMTITCVDPKSRVERRTAITSWQPLARRGSVGTMRAWEALAVAITAWLFYFFGVQLGTAVAPSLLPSTDAPPAAGATGGSGGVDDLAIDLGPAHAPLRLLAYGSLENYWKGEHVGGSGSEGESQQLANLCEQSTGCALWPAARILISYLRARPALFAGKSALELGSGSGAVGLAMRRMGAAGVELTDVAAALPLLRSNARRNGMGGENGGDDGVRVGTLQWEAELPARILREPPQLVVGSDIVYGVSEKAELPLVHTLVRFASLRPAPTIVMAMVDRGDGHAPFLAVAARHCLNVTTIHHVADAAPPTEQGAKRNDAFVRRLALLESCTMPQF